MSAKPPSYDETLGATAPQYPPVTQPPGPGYGSAATGSYQSTGYPPQQPPYPDSYQAGAPPQNFYKGPPGYQPAPPTDSHGSTTILVTPQPNVIVVGGCPACRVGVLEDDFTCLGVCCAVFFFPLGILCCLALKQRRCNHCGAVFG